ncbi:hypothetical protein FF2_009792 [Malus domestica]
MKKNSWVSHTENSSTPPTPTQRKPPLPCDSEQTDKDWLTGGRSDPRPLVGGGRRKKGLLVTRARVTRSTLIASRKDP